MKMKKLIALLLVLAMAFSMVACSSTSDESTDEETTETTEETASEPQTVVFWHSMTDTSADLIDQFVTEFNETIGAEKNITVEAVFQGDYADASTKLNTILNTEQYDQLPSVMQIDATGIVAYKSSGVAYTVDDALAADDYDLSSISASPLAAWNYEDVQYGVPFTCSTTITYYNATLFEEAGIDVPTTFAEIAAAAADFPTTTDSGQDLTLFAGVPTTPTLANWIGQLDGYVLNNNNGRIGTADTLICDDEGTLETFLTEWKGMYDAGALANESASSDAFFAGQLAMFVGSSSNVATYLEAIGDSFELGTTYFPKVTEDASYGATTAGSGLFMFDLEDDALNEAAWEFVKYMISADVQAVLAEETGYIPVNNDAATSETYLAFVEEYPQYEIAMTQLSETPAAMSSITVGPSTDFYYAIMDGVTTMLDSGDSVADTVESMSSTLQGLLDQYALSNPEE